MKTIRTIKIKLGENISFDSLCKQFLDACNYISPIIYKTKELNSIRLHKKYYTSIRKRFNLHSQLSCSVFKYVSASFQSQKTQKKWNEVTYKKSVIPIVWKRDFSFSKTKGICFWGKPIEINDKRLPPTETWKDSKLKKVGKEWYLILSHIVDIPELKTEGCIVGVDSGIKRIFTATNSMNSKTFTFHGGELNSRRLNIRRVRSQVQAVGSRSSRRLLQRMRSNEASITALLMHTASKRLVAWADSLGTRRIVMENLANVREASIDKGKNLRDKVMRWPYAQGQFFTQYKSAEKGIELELVSPKNTSRGCPSCGNIDSRNRNGLKFRCILCGYTGDADRIASINIRNRSVVTRHNLVTTGSNNTPKSSEPLEIVSDSHDSLSSRLQSRFTAKTQPSSVVG